MKLGKTQLISLFTDIRRRGLTDGMFRTLIDSLWRDVFYTLRKGFIDFFYSIRVGPWLAATEGDTPEAGSLQYTPENGLQIWNGATEAWESVGGASHPAVTIATGSAALASIDENQELTINEPLRGCLPNM